MNRVAALEASGRAALPALREERVGDWLVRVSGGSTKRVNSVNPVIAGARIEDAATMERICEAHVLPCRFRLTPLADAGADAILAERGYEVVDRSWKMVASLDGHQIATPAKAGAQSRAASQLDPGLRRGDGEVVFSSSPDADWLMRVEPLSGRSPEDAAVQAQLLAAMPGPLALARIEEDGMVLAAGYASIGEGRAQLSDIVVAPHARARGLGRRLVAGLLGWAQAQGCAEAMLQVLDGNHVARGLYRSLGFVDAYPYHYRVRR